MAKIAEISQKNSQFLQFSSLPWLNQALTGGIVRGGVYLLAGAPGLGKTTLANQILGDLALQGRKVLFISTEQSLHEIKAALARVHGKEGVLPTAILQNLFADDSVNDVDGLLKFLNRRVLPSGEEYSGVEIIVIDSIQGNGLSSNATKKYGALYEFLSATKAHGIATVLVGHITKTGQIAGPRNLEHNVDTVVHLRRAFNLRPLFIPKNRFGPAVTNPIVLMMDECGRLIQSPISSAKPSVVYGYADRLAMAEAQASVSLPKYGTRPKINAPCVPEKRIRQLVKILNTLPSIDLNDFDYQIECYLPGHQKYIAEMDLALSTALLSSYVQQPVPANTLFIGEVDLTTRVRTLCDSCLEGLGELLLMPTSTIKRVYIAKESAARLGHIRAAADEPRLGSLVQIIGVENLEELLRRLWPTLFSDTADQQRLSLIA